MTTGKVTSEEKAIFEFDHEGHFRIIVAGVESKPMLDDGIATVEVDGEVYIGVGEYFEGVFPTNQVCKLVPLETRSAEAYPYDLSKSDIANVQAMAEADIANMQAMAEAESVKRKILKFAKLHNAMVNPVYNLDEYVQRYLERGACTCSSTRRKCPCPEAAEELRAAHRSCDGGLLVIKVKENYMSYLGFETDAEEQAATDELDINAKLANLGDTVKAKVKDIVEAVLVEANVTVPVGRQVNMSYTAEGEVSFAIVEAEAKKEPTVRVRGTPVKVDGVEYPSSAAACKALGIDIAFDSAPRKLLQAKRNGIIKTVEYM